MVPGTGLEPASPKAADFKSAMFTNFITPAGARILTSPTEIRQLGIMGVCTHCAQQRRSIHAGESRPYRDVA